MLYASLFTPSAFPLQYLPPPPSPSSWFIDQQLVHTYWPGPFTPQLLRPLFLFGSLHRPDAPAAAADKAANGAHSTDSSSSAGNQGARALWQGECRGRLT